MKLSAALPLLAAITTVVAHRNASHVGGDVVLDSRICCKCPDGSTGCDGWCYIHNCL